ncbi:MAG: type II toxin-antitoxin system VapC family toxin [Halanaeroarchaeum sp.]
MYLDTDVILALLKVDDWLTSEVDRDGLRDPITSTATAIELQYVMQDEWERDRLAKTHVAIAEEGIDLVPLTSEDIEAAGSFRESYEEVGVFDSIHLGVAHAREEPIVSTDTLYPDIHEVEHLDPRDIE